MVKTTYSTAHTGAIILLCSTCLLFIISRLLYFTLSSFSDSIMIILLHLVTWIVVFAGITLCIYFLSQQRRKNLFINLLLITIHIVTITSTIYIPYTATSINIDVFLKQRAREAIIQHVIEQFYSIPRSEENTSVVIDLPRPKSYLSAGGGQVIVQEDDTQLLIMFYTWRGFLDSSSGLVIYTSHDVAPNIPFMNGTYRIKNKWFFGIAY